MPVEACANSGLQIGEFADMAKSFLPLMDILADIICLKRIPERLVPLSDSPSPIDWRSEQMQMDESDPDTQPSIASGTSGESCLEENIRNFVYSFMYSCLLYLQEEARTLCWYSNTMGTEIAVGYEIFICVLM